MKNKRYILTGYRAGGIKIHDYGKNSRYYLGLGLISFGVVSWFLPTASPLWVALGSMMMIPISLKHQIRNKAQDLKHYINKRFVLWGFK